MNSLGNFLCTYIYVIERIHYSMKIKYKYNAMIGLVCTLSKFTYLLCIDASFEYCMRGKRKFDFDSTNVHIHTT